MVSAGAIWIDELASGLGHCFIVLDARMLGNQLGLSFGSDFSKEVRACDRRLDRSAQKA